MQLSTGVSNDKVVQRGYTDLVIFRACKDLAVHMASGDLVVVRIQLPTELVRI